MFIGQKQVQQVLKDSDESKLRELESDDFRGWCPDYWELLGKRSGLKGSKLAEFAAKPLRKNNKSVKR